MTFNKHDPFNQFRSGKTAKVVTEQELAEQKARKEQSHQLEFCKWIKHNTPKSDSVPICRRDKNGQAICRTLSIF